MKSVAIISRHAISNYGSLLQAYALEQTIRSLGYDAKTIDYIRKDEKSWHLCKVELAGSRWNSSFPKRVAFYGVNVPNRAIQFSKFSKFRRELLNLTKEYCSIEELKANPPVADLYCTGSDQVWNETIYDQIDWTYFLEFLNSEARIAYAASFGKETVKDELRDRIKSDLQNYSKISVRESSGKDILRNLEIAGDVVLDPTLLLDRNKWEQLIDGANALDEDYILLYQIHKNNQLVEYARNYAKQIGCRVISISVSFTQRKSGIELKWLPDYKEVLALFRGARCIVTDSFHATAFSINFNKQFVTILPKLSAARIKSILSMMGLENRVLTDITDYSLPETTINYAQVNPVLEELRNDSIGWLKRTLVETIGE